MILMCRGSNVLCQLQGFVQGELLTYLYVRTYLNFFFIVLRIMTGTDYATCKVASKRPEEAAIARRSVMDPRAATGTAFQPQATTLPMLLVQRAAEISFGHYPGALDTKWSGSRISCVERPWQSGLIG
jgi:hypothetical protein